MRTLGISLAFALFLVALIPAAESAQKDGLAARVAQLEAQVAVMEEILQFVYVETEEINGLAGPHWIVEGANVHVRSGSGSTNFRICHPSGPGCGPGTGLGNLVVGYNELPPSQTRPNRGMHNLVVGPGHTYRSTGGFIAGSHNSLSGLGGWGASVTGGENNEASGHLSSVSGGNGNVASATWSSVSGGENRVAPDDFNWAAGSLFEEN